MKKKRDKSLDKFIHNALSEGVKKYYVKKKKRLPKRKQLELDTEDLKDTVMQGIDAYLKTWAKENIVIDTGEDEGSIDDRRVIKETSKMSMQKKHERLVINMPKWLKDRLAKISKRSGLSMNEIIRSALVDYLLKEE